MALPVRRLSNLATWDPFRDMGDLHARMSQVLDSAFGETGLPTPQRWAPPIDIEETDEAFVVEADLPGVNREDITVDLNGNELSVHGEITERERTGVLRHKTRRTGQFDYRVTLPGDVDGEKVDATLNDGVLRLDIRKAETAKSKRIEITS